MEQRTTKNQLNCDVVPFQSQIEFIDIARYHGGKQAFFAYFEKLKTPIDVNLFLRPLYHRFVHFMPTVLDSVYKRLNEFYILI